MAREGIQPRPLNTLTFRQAYVSLLVISNYKRHMVFSAMTDFLKHLFLISRGLAELITPSQSRNL